MENNCILHLIKIVFDDFQFNRCGFKNNNPPEIKVGIVTKKHIEGEDTHRVSIKLELEKKDEFNLNISITGYFKYSGDDLKRNDFLNQNAVAIVMPYLRSQVSLLTCQPSMEPIVLPPFNIVDILNSSKNNLE